VGQLEAAQLARMRPRERAPLVAEELGLHEPVGDGREVHRHERLLAARALAVEGPRHQLLAGAALARDEHGRVRLRDLGDALVQAHHRGVAAHEGLEALPPVELRAEVLDLGLQAAVLHGGAGEAEDLVHLEGLHDVVERALLHALDGRPHVGQRGHQDHRERLVHGQQARQHDGSRLAGKPHVEEDHVDPPRAEHVQRGRALLDAQHLELEAEDLADRVLDGGLVVDDERHRPRPVRGSGLGHERREARLTGREP
jgi:hypothetical protein